MLSPPWGRGGELLETLSHSASSEAAWVGRGALGEVLLKSRWSCRCPAKLLPLTIPPLPHWPLHVLGGWTGGVGWSQEAIRTEAVSKQAPFREHSQVLPTSPFSVPYLPPLPATMLTMSNVQMGKQRTCPKISSLLRGVDFLSPPFTPSVHSAGFCPDLQAKTMPY